MSPERNLVRLLASLILVLGLALVHLDAGPIDIVFSAKPQFAGNSCRAYALALAAGTVPGSPVPIDNVSQLRAVERDLQARLDSTAKKMGPPNTASSHSVWQRAISEMTSNSLEAVVEYAPTLDKFYDRVATLTGQSNANAFGALFSSAIVKTPVMTSVTKIGQDSYSPSHIVTLYGVGSGPSSAPGQRPLAVLNPAVKVANAQQKICDVGSVNDERWSAIVSLESSYALTNFPEGHLVMWIRKK